MSPLWGTLILVFSLDSVNYNNWNLGWLCNLKIRCGIWPICSRLPIIGPYRKCSPKNKPLSAHSTSHSHSLCNSQGTLVRLPSPTTYPHSSALPLSTQSHKQPTQVISTRIFCSLVGELHALDLARPLNSHGVSCVALEATLNLAPLLNLHRILLDSSTTLDTRYVGLPSILFAHLLSSC
jgi:hypothetical protein